ncbi:MAG: hypothetical protein Q9P44_04800 [Anaerolineae bacterium]|nr:hypothetical protein [Anaerolineae bacterium]
MAYSTQQQAKRSGAGCWVTGIISIAVAMLLVIVGLFLPPFDLYNRLVGEQFTTLTQVGDAVISPDGGLSFAVATQARSEFGVRVDVTSLQDFEASNTAAGDWIPLAKSSVPYYLALQSAVYTVATDGQAADAIFLSVQVTNNVASTDLLDMYGWYGNSTNTGGQWEFIPSQVVDNRLETTVERIPEHLALFQAAPDVPEVLATYNVSQALTAEVADIATIIAPGGLQPLVDGTVTGSLAAGSSQSALYRLMPMLSNFDDPAAIDVQTVNTIMSNSQLRATHARQIAAVINANGYDGVFIDYRGITIENRENFTLFIRDLNANIDNVGKSLGVVVVAAENVDGLWQTGGYDWRALGAEVDYFQIQFGLNPQLFTPDDNQFVYALLTWAVREVNRYKVLIGLSSQSVREIVGNYNSIGYDAALAGLGGVTIAANDVSATGTIQPGTEIRASLDGRRAIGGFDTIINTPFLDYLDDAGNTTARMWITTGNALRFRIDRTVPFALGGVAFDDLVNDDRASGVLSAISAYRTQIPTVPSTTEWVLRWRIVGSDGNLMQQVDTSLSDDLVITLDVPDGNYAINPSVVLIQENIEDESARTGAQVALFRPTPTPTPLPTATPTDVPTPTPTLPPVVATNPPPPPDTSNPGGGGQGAVAVGPGSINLSGFEYGGHVTGAGSARAADAMRSAGMTWMKVQIRYTLGAPASTAAGAIDAAHAAGFKILVGTVGNPNDLASGGDAYIQQYANWLGGIAALGADAIEVWNEPNIDREWPRGQISGAAFANMLRQANAAIRAGNGGTIIISGATAPTGAEAAFPGQVVNDDNFMRQFVNAGGLSYVDCVGMHYNEGIVPPTQTSGDPRGDNYYTRYLPNMVNVYRSIVGNKALCFTELGYLTSEGYPPLPSFFSWAQNVTLAQQASWLAGAASYLSQQSNVRLMIVWNVDFTLYAGDPQGGYAMIRPGGDCPACSALAGAR